MVKLVMMAMAMMMMTMMGGDVDDDDDDDNDDYDVEEDDDDDDDDGDPAEQSYSISFGGAIYPVQVAGIPHQQAIQDAASAYFDGWEVDFSSDEDPEVALLGLQSLNIPPEKFIFGVAALSGDLEAHLPSDSAPYAKIFTLDPTSSTAFRDAMRAMNSAGRAPRGFMFWCAEDEARSSSPFYMSRGLSDVLMMKAMTTSPSNRDDNDPSHHFGASDELGASSPSRIDYTATSDGNKHSIRQ